MRQSFVAIAFGLVMLVDGLGSFFAAFAFLGMMTNANGFMSGVSDDAMLVAILAFPLGFVGGALLFKRMGLQAAGLIVGVVPIAIAYFVLR